MIAYYTLNRDIYVPRGSDVKISCAIFNTAGAPLNLTGYTLLCNIMPYYGVGAITPGATYVYTNIATGQFDLIIDDAVKLPKDRYVYEVFAVNAPEKYKIQLGQLLVT